MNKPIEVEERPSDDLPLVVFKPVVDPGLKSALQRFQSQQKGQSGDDSKSKIPVCSNRGCGKSYEGTVKDEPCSYHPGVPIFHEGMKFWSCCQRKTTDFNQFLEQAPCAKGEHKWVDPEVRVLD
jgi:hypothetical protein